MEEVYGSRGEYYNLVIYHEITATFLPPRKLSKLDEPDMQDTAEEAGTSS